MSDSGGGLARAFTPGRPALVAYVMAGYPDRAASLAALHALAEGGADLIELGVPYADPLADGPTIVHAAETARSADPGGFGLTETIGLVTDFLAERDGSAPPIALMTYLNPLHADGATQGGTGASRCGCERCDRA